MKYDDNKKNTLREMYKDIEKEIRKEDDKHQFEINRLIAVRKNLEKKGIVPSIDKTLYNELLRKKIEPKLGYFQPVTRKNYKDFIDR